MELGETLGIVHWLSVVTIRADRVVVRAYLVFYSVQTGTDGVAATVLALFYEVKHKVRDTGCVCVLGSLDGL